MPLQPQTYKHTNVRDEYYDDLHASRKTQFLKLLNCHIDLFVSHLINPLTPNDHYRCRTAPLKAKNCILYIYLTNISTEYFKHGIYSPFSSLQNAVCFIILKYLVPALFTFYIQDVLKLKKFPAPKG